jgi:glycosyltransferase involved in cell wall biosynthesis
LSDELWREAFGDGLIPVEDEAAYFDAAYQLCLDREKLKKFTHISQSLYQDQFTWERIAQRLLDAFEKAERTQ